MKTLNRYILPSLGVILAVGQASGQTLSKEVVIEREITPVERAATRPQWVRPEVLIPTTSGKRLQPAEYTGTAELTRTTGRLEPVAWKDTIAVSPYRGYGALGYFPAFNLGASAGYRFLQNDRSSAGAWLQYDGASWSGFDKDGKKTSLHTFTLGADGSHRFNAGRLSADFGFTTARSSMAPLSDDGDEGTQTLNAVDLALGWDGKAIGRVSYGVGAHIGYTALGKSRTVVASPFVKVPTSLIVPEPQTLNPNKETEFGVNARGEYKVGARSSWSLNVDADFLKRKADARLLPWKRPISAGLDDFIPDLTVAYGYSGTIGDIALTPAYHFSTGNFSGQLGARIDIGTGRESGVNLAPAVNLGWVPSPFFAVSLEATGGQILNRATDLFTRMPWTTGTFFHGRSNIPFDGRLALTAGQWNGFSATLHAGWSRAEDWLTPVRLDNIYTNLSRTIDGFNYGLALGYQFKKLFRVSASAEGASHGDYYRWTDNASWVFDLAAEVTPIDRLAIEAGWNVRVDRQFLVVTPALTSDGTAGQWYARWDNAGDANNLHLGAKWAFTDAFTVFVKVENLLNHHWSLLPGLRSNGIRGAIGVELKF